VRIVVVTTSYPKSEDDPAGHFVRAEARALERQGHDVVVHAPAGDAFGWPGVAARLRERPWRIGNVASELARLRTCVKRAKVDRVVAHWCVPSAFPLCLGLRVELEVVSHGGDVRLLLALPGAVRSVIVKRIAKEASVWRFVSDALRDDLVRAIPRDARLRVEAIARVQPCAIAMPDVSALVATHRENRPKKRLAVCVARLVASKRIDHVIEHAART
jgi:teichuronic acid biosynthesis glycosyltransferase TuaC